MPDVFTTDYEATVQRILDILQADPDLKGMVAEWRFGHLPENARANFYPAAYVTTARSPEVSRDNYGFTDGEQTGIQPVITEYWVILVSDPSVTPEDAQRTVYRMRKQVVSVIKQNMRLRPPSDSEADGGRPLSDHTHVMSTPRLTEYEGKLVESMTVMIRVLTHEGPVPQQQQ